MRTWPSLDIVIPSHQKDQHHLTRLLQSISKQTYPPERINIHVITEGDSEEAKAIGIRQCRGDIVGMFCTDNVLLEPDFLEVMVDAANRPEVVGAYTARYAYVPQDTPLSRYFALNGGNDPLCTWLGKNDRATYTQKVDAWIHLRTFSPHEPLPAIGDNGCFFKRYALALVVNDPTRFGSCMDMAVDLHRRGYATYAVVGSHALWHKSGASLWTYLTKRWRYTNALYFDKRHTRRWHLVATRRDWLATLLFAVAAVLVVPQVFVSIRGYRSKRDVAWAWHPVVCCALTLIYTCSLMKHLWSSLHSIVRRS